MTIGRQVGDLLWEQRYDSRGALRGLGDLRGAVVRGVYADREIFLLWTTLGVFVFHHWQSCCESVEIIGTAGDPGTLVGKTVQDVRMSVRSSDEEEQSETWTDIEICTEVDQVVINYHGSSNGYYSERVAINRLVDHTGVLIPGREPGGADPYFEIVPLVAPEEATEEPARWYRGYAIVLERNTTVEDLRVIMGSAPMELQVMPQEDCWYLVHTDTLEAEPGEQLGESGSCPIALANYVSVVCTMGHRAAVRLVEI